MAYYELALDDVDNPYEEGLYEFVSGSYVLSTDLVPDETKTYYVSDDYDEEEDLENPIEYADPENEDFAYYAVDEPEANPEEAEYYERDADGSYYQTEDVTVDPSKVYYIAVEPADYSDFDEEILDEPYATIYVTDPELTEPIPVGSDAYAETEVTADVTLSDISGFVYAYTSAVSNPQAAGLYEVENGLFIRTTDTELVYGKTYYEHLEYSDFYEVDMTGVSNPVTAPRWYYEKVSGNYVPTTDTNVVSGKTYYCAYSDEYREIKDPTLGEAVATWDDLPYASDGE